MWGHVANYVPGFTDCLTTPQIPLCFVAILQHLCARCGIFPDPQNAARFKPDTERQIQRYAKKIAKNRPNLEPDTT